MQCTRYKPQERPIEWKTSTELHILTMIKVPTTIVVGKHCEIICNSKHMFNKCLHGREEKKYISLMTKMEPQKFTQLKMHVKHTRESKCANVLKDLDTATTQTGRVTGLHAI